MKVLCLGINGTWRVGGADARAAGSVLVQTPAVPVPKVLPEAGEYAPLWSGLFRPLRFPAYKGTLVCLGVSFKKASAWFLVFAQLWGLESTPRIKAQVIRAMVSVSRDPWISEERAGKELMQEKDSGAKLNSTGRGLHLRRRR